MERKKRVKPYPPLAGRTFAKVSELEAEIRRILKTYPTLNTPVEGEDGELITAYMRTHESLAYQEERSGPLQHVEIRFNPAITCSKPEDRRQVWLVFENGDAEPFSYKAVRSNWGVENIEEATFRTHRTWVSRAARCSVNKDINEYRQAVLEGPGVCELSGEKLSIADADVHHDGRSFQWLLFDWCKSYCETKQITFAQLASKVRDLDTKGTKDFGEESTNESWVDYHTKNARLVCITKKVHRTLHRNMPEPPWKKLA